MRQILEQAEQKSPHELLDDVHRRLTLYLCRRCYVQWIENPAG